MKIDGVRANHTQAILLNVPLDLLVQLDNAAAVLRLSRTRLILRSLHRELSTDLKDEVDRYQGIVARDFASWPL